MKGEKEKTRIGQLIKKGVRIHKPYTVYIGEEVSLDRISPKGVVIYPGTRVLGPETTIMEGCELGKEGTTTVDNCQMGPGVRLKGGYFLESTLLDRVSLGPAAHVRQGCLLEEEASGAHSIGLKHTILFPFVTLGSLINFCDCLMAGGTDRRNHSEVGSSFIHFNYTPEQHKATPSLVGDVPGGVMLNQNPIFLGGQGGIAGPVRIGYGIVLAAGTICRKDILKKDATVFFGTPANKELQLNRGLYLGIKRIIKNNINYIANIIALRRWYLDIRSGVAGGDLERLLFEGALKRIDMAIQERINRLKEVSEKMPQSVEKNQKERTGAAKIGELMMEFFNKWPAIETYMQESFKKEGDPQKREMFLALFQKNIKNTDNDYMALIQGLSETDKTLGTMWLQGIVDEINSGVTGIMGGL